MKQVIVLSTYLFLSVTDAACEKVVAQLNGAPDREKAKAFEEEVKAEVKGGDSPIFRNENHGTLGIHGRLESWIGDCSHPEDACSNLDNLLTFRVFDVFRGWPSSLLGLGLVEESPRARDVGYSRR